MTEPQLQIELIAPTVDSLAIFVELLDHIGVDGETLLATTSVGHGAITAYVDALSIYIPPVDFNAVDEEQ